MAEGAIQPHINHENGPENRVSANTTLNVEELPQAAASSRPTVIWTPSFIVIFALTFVSGLSAEGLLAQGWINSYYTGQWIFQVHVILISLCWLAMLVLARSKWIRVGSIFGCIWALFMTLNISIIALHHANSTSSVLIHVNAATCIALLGAYICLSIDKTPLSRLDAWFFGFAPIGGSIAVALIYYMTPAHVRSLNTLENAIATVALVLSLLVWWIRPTSWKAQPGPAFLFGSVPILLLLLAISNPIGFVRFNMSNFFLPHLELYAGPLTDEAHFFYAEVALLCLLLGIMRVLQHERRAYPG